MGCSWQNGPHTRCFWPRGRHAGCCAPGVCASPFPSPSIDRFCRRGAGSLDTCAVAARRCAGTGAKRAGRVENADILALLALLRGSRQSWVWSGKLHAAIIRVGKHRDVDAADSGKEIPLAELGVDLEQPEFAASHIAFEIHVRNFRITDVAQDREFESGEVFMPAGTGIAAAAGVRGGPVSNTVFGTGQRWYLASVEKRDLSSSCATRVGGGVGRWNLTARKWSWYCATNASSGSAVGEKDRPAAEAACEVRQALEDRREIARKAASLKPQIPAAVARHRCGSAAGLAHYRDRDPFPPEGAYGVKHALGCTLAGQDDRPR